MSSFAGDGEYVFLTLEIPDDKVLLSEHTLWECALNNIYIPSGMKDEDSEDMGEKEKSWEIMFDLDRRSRFSPMMRRNKLIQATFWELRPEWVKGCMHFKVHREDLDSEES